MVWCDNCARNVTTHNYDGMHCCPHCGRVTHEDRFSTETTFMKNAAGRSQAMGVNVKTVQTDYSASRERILDNARENMRHLARSVMMDDGDIVVMPATRFYTIALERNFTRGRRRELVEAACIYIALREANKPYLLIDFSDYLRINVYELGGTFLQLCKLLSLEDHPIVQRPVDPSLFIHRYAERLVGEGDGYQEISKTAMRIVASMKRDWMQTGRKPSGLCGAALYISALSHGQKCSKSDIVKVVHICEATLTKRLVEFESTESGSLTIEEFEAKAKELEIEYISAKERDFFGKFGSNKWLCDHRNGEEAPFAHGLCKKCFGKVITFYGGLDGGSEPPAFQRAESIRMIQNSGKDNSNSLEPNEKELEIPNTCGNEKSQLIEAGTSSDYVPVDKITFDKLHGADGTSSTAHDESEGFSDIDDIEVDGYLHTEEEKHYKKIIWEEMNKEFVEEQAAKEAVAKAEAAKKALLAKSSNCPEEVEAAQELAALAAEAVAKTRKEKKQMRDAEAKKAGPATTPSEAARQMISKKRLSSRINYDVLDKLFDDSDAPENQKKIRNGSLPSDNPSDETIEKSLGKKGVHEDSYDDAYDDQAYDENMQYGNAEEVYGLDGSYCDEGFW